MNVSNSLPTNEDICSSVIITWSVSYSAQRYRVSPSQINLGIDRSECFVEEFCQLREKKMEEVERKRKTDRVLYNVEVIEVDTTRKQLKIHFVGFSHE